MKALKRVCIVIYAVTLVLAGIAFLGKDVGDQALREAIVYKSEVSKITDIVKAAYPDMTNEQMDEVYNLINDNEYLSDITTMYIEAFEEYVADGEKTGDIADYLDRSEVTDQIGKLADQIMNQILNGTNTQLSSFQKAILSSVTTYISSNIEKEITQQCNNAVKLVSDRSIILMKCYIVITSVAARIVLVIILVLMLAAIVYMNTDKLRVLYNIGAPTLLAGIVTVALSYIGESTIRKLSNQLAGRTISADMTPGRIYGLILFAIGAVLTVGWIVINRKKKE